MNQVTDKIIDLPLAAQSFAALGSEQRLSVLQALVAAGPDGLAAGVLAERVGLGASTLTHHLRFLTQSGLVRQEKQGRSVRSFADFEAVQRLSAYLLLNCCAEAHAACKHQEHDHD
ncbi:ArsR/SmtB family transcription factor [Halovulum sp. GXIMD14794]